MFEAFSAYVLPNSPAQQLQQQQKNSPRLLPLLRNFLKHLTSLTYILTYILRMQNMCFFFY